MDPVLERALLGLTNPWYRPPRQAARPGVGACQGMRPHDAVAWWLAPQWQGEQILMRLLGIVHWRFDGLQTLRGTPGEYTPVQLWQHPWNQEGLGRGLERYRKERFGAAGAQL